MFLHELPDAKDLFLVISAERNIEPSIVEKDYWVMHALWGLQQQQYNFELKGGTSLSKGYNIINRFSEDIDVQVHPEPGSNIKTGRNHDKPAHIQGRRDFFDGIAEKLSIPGLTFERDHEFDDKKMRSAGIRGLYTSYFEPIQDLKEGILFEMGFDKTTPYEEKKISSWAYDKTKKMEINVINNCAENVKCYCREYTFVEKLQTISTKYRKNKKEGNDSPVNFIRHYYDIYMLLDVERVAKFIGTDEYKSYKQKKFAQADELDISKNLAFQLTGPEEIKKFSELYNKKSEIYFKGSLQFEDILNKIKQHANQL
jgi:hypothetical protein